MMKWRQQVHLGSIGRKSDTDDGVVTSADGTERREIGGDNVNWTDMNFTGPKNEEN
jgi:hypothetical protein